MLDAGTLFSGSESYIKQIRLPYSLHVCRFVLSKVILFAHDFPIYVALMLYFQIWPGAVALYAIPGFLLLVANAALISLSIGMTSARFRDIPRIISSLIQVSPDKEVGEVYDGLPFLKPLYGPPTKRCVILPCSSA